MGKIFETSKRIKLGIWGLGRGRAFIQCCEALNIDIVAGCDINEGMCDAFKKICPEAYITQNEDDFLAQDMDAVLVATYFFAHAKDSIKALKSGKHVLSEVSAFFTPAEGVRLVEEVEKSSKVYMLAENYADQFMKQLWQEGVFGELIYGEMDYVHECRALSYSYLYGDPIIPGNTAHSWRSWLNFHYYCTHSLGAAMEITSLRPERICAPPCPHNLPGYLPDSEMGRMAPSFVTMENGGVIRNLMGASTHDSHTKRIWGSRAFVDFTEKEPVVRLGQSGRGPKVKLTRQETPLTKLAATSGHGGGDFYVLYHFANAVLNGVKPFWDVYFASDVTLCGIMAVKSQYNGGVTLDIPDFRKKEVRDEYRNDHFCQKALDPAKIFPEEQDTAQTGKFSCIVGDLDKAWAVKGVPLFISVMDGMKLYPYITDPESRLAIEKNARTLLQDLPALADTLREARKLAELYPESPGGKALQSFIDAASPEKWEDIASLKGELQNFILKAGMPVLPQLRMILEGEALAAIEKAPVPEGFRVRTFREGDEASYVELMRKAGFLAWGKIQLENVRSNVLGDGVFFLEEIATGCLAASCMANKAKAESGDSFCGELGWLGADPAYRGKHFAEILCREVLVHYQKNGYKKVFLRTDDHRLAALKTYLHLGFKPVCKAEDEEMRKRWESIYKKFGLLYQGDQEN